MMLVREKCYRNGGFKEGSSPKVPWLRLDMYFATPSMIGPATNVASSDAMNEDTFVAPTALTEKLYGGAEKICDKVIEIRTSQEIQIVNNSVAHITTGLANVANGRRNVRQNETWSQYPDQGSRVFVYDMRG